MPPRLPRRCPRPCGWPAAAALLLAAGAGAWAQSVQFSGSLGSSRALLLVDGNPVTLAVGASAQGVTLTRLDGAEAEVRVQGQLLRLRLGATPARLGAAGPAPGSGQTIVLPVGPGGHHVAQALVNGRPVAMLVDTGATFVAFSQGEATRLGLDWRQGQPMISATANGAVPVQRITLARLRIGDVELQGVEAVVVPAEMPMALLGNSFLARFSMAQDGGVMRLTRKP